ncbi:hypothetical protein LWF01_13655 [Saxibacter everestensis]|uniref:Uncharacterized protein n=1 Tax=Saxibacter everestensis TaxID=2909229 RepID=A0ABY8QQ70_9MICO|nr:hypothetical protein LWF01_13655 [Brevibacteriaceae bacterium ZFBP1038]
MQSPFGPDAFGTVVEVDGVDLVRNGSLLLDAVGARIGAGSTGRCLGPMVPGNQLC